MEKMLFKSTLKCILKPSCHSCLTRATAGGLRHLVVLKDAFNLGLGPLLALQHVGGVLASFFEVFDLEVKFVLPKMVL